MCGICGAAIGSEPFSSSVLRQMAETIRHRGPDDDGFHEEAGAALGFRRLSIIDLSGGHQPMASDDGALWVVFNGEIYNYQALRQELEATGRHRFKTTSDTEVLLHLFQEHGEDCLGKLRGMFAFAIWNRKTETLFAARDRFGKKPFYYFEHPSAGLVFASQLNALRKHPLCPSAVDPQAIHLYLSLQYIPSPWTIYQSVRKLPAAHCLRWSKRNGLHVRRYWDLRYDPKSRLSFGEAKQRLRSLLEESVRLRMISDVPLGAFLSGGIDSSIIVALMAQQSSQPIKTFSIGFEEESYSEVAFARQVAERYHTDHHEFIVKPELIDVLPKLAWHYGEPFADSSALPSYYLARETRQHVTVALTGDGGDEMFCGYLRYRALWGMQFYNRLPSALRRTLATVGHRLPARSPIDWTWRIRRLLDVGALEETPQYLRTVDYFHTEEQDELWTSDHVSRFQSAGISSGKLFEETLARQRPTELLDRLMLLDVNYYLPDCLMVKVDVASMAHSLEARAPLLDSVLADEVAHWPADWKYQPLQNSKRILKDTFAQDLPPEILNRGKKGFGVPISHWFRGPLKGYLRDILLSPEALGRGYFRPETVRRYLDEHQSGQRERGYGLWALLMLELWHRTK